MASETLTLIINADSKDAVSKLNAVKKGLNDQEASTKSLGGSLDKLKTSWLATAAVMATVAMAYKKVITDASNLQEVTSKFNVVFKGQTDLAEDMARTLVDSYAMSTREAKQYLSSVQDLLVPMGMAADKAALMSNEVVKLAADLGSFNNVSTEQAMMDIQSALVGNYETMKKYGVVLNETVIKQEAMRQGLWDGKGVLDANTKAQIAFELAMRGSAAAQGDMIRTGDSWANVQKKIMARIEDISAGIGQQMLPSLTRLGQAFITSTQSGGLLNVVISAITKTIALATNSIAQLITFIDRLSNNSKQRDADKQRRADLYKIAAIYRELGVMQGYDIENISKYNKEFKRRVDAGQVDLETKNKVSALMKNAIDSGQKKADLALQDADMAKRTEEINNAILNGEKQINEAKKEGLELQGQLNDSKSGGAGSSSPEDALAEQKAREMEVEAAYYEELGAFRDEWRAIEDEKENAIFEARVEKAAQVLDAVAQTTAQIGQLFAMSYQNDQIKLDNWYQKKKQTIEKTVKDEDKKAAALAKLDDEYNDKKKKNARDYAKTKKAIAIVEAIIGTALGVTNSLSQGGVMGIVMAAIVGALGIAEIALIASQEIPAAASGALIKGSAAGTMIQAGEGGRSEMIVPFENPEVMDKIGGFGGGTHYHFNIGQLYATDDLPGEFAVAIDRALYKLKVNKNSVLF